VTTPSAGRAAAAHTAGRATSDPAPPVPTPTTADPPADPPDAGPDRVTADRVTADRVTAREIAEFLRHLAELRAGTRGGDPAERAAFLARKAELFTRLAADPTASSAPEGRTP
jgi:hypothetical protein